MILTKSKTVFNKCVCTENLWVAVSSLANNVHCAIADVVRWDPHASILFVE